MPKPTTTPNPRLLLPDGGLLQGFPALAAQTAACSATSNLLSQIAPLLALMHCQAKVLNLLKPLIDVIKGLPNPSAHAMQEFAKAALDLQPCLATLAPANQIGLAHDLICLEIRGLTCFLDNLKSALGNPTALGNVLSSYAPIVGVVSLAGDVFLMAGMQVPQAPALSGKTDQASLSADAKAVRAFMLGLQSIVDIMGGC
jgi:hypothetical protein